MANPTRYERSYSFTDWQANNPTSPPPGLQIDGNYDDIEEAIDSICDCIEDIRRSDGALVNGIVTPDSLDATLKALVAYTGATVRGAWVTATSYAIADIVQQDGSNFYCLVAHTAGTFATDLAAGKWMNTSAASASGVAFTPAGSISAVTVQAAVEEVSGDVATEAAARLAADVDLAAQLAVITASNWVTQARMADNSVGTAEIIDANVTAIKLATDAVTTAKIAAGAVTGPKLGAITAAEIYAALATKTGTGNPVFDTSPTITTPNIVGTGTNNNASAGSIGEVLTAALAGGSATSLTSNTPKTVTSLSLTAGDWDVWASGGFTNAATTSFTAAIVCISDTTNALSAYGVDGECRHKFAAVVPNTDALVFPAGTVRISLAATTTVYLVLFATFTVSTAGGYGKISARRRR
jgi:hypothetical protein